MGLRCAALLAAAAELILTAGMARADGIVTSLNFGRGNPDGWAAFSNANAAAGLTTIPPYWIALYRAEDDPIGAVLSRAGNARPLSIQFSGKAFENPLFATAPFSIPVAPPPAVTTSHPVAPDSAFGQAMEPAAPVPPYSAASMAPPIPQPLLSVHPDGASAGAWSETERRDHADWSFDNPWIYEPEPVPEPGTVALLSLGLALLALRGRLPIGRRSRSRDLR